MKITAYVTHSDCSLHDTGWGHPEHQGRLPAVARAVYRDMLTLFEPLLEVEATPATDADLLLAHTRVYIDRVRTRSDEAASAGAPLTLEGETVVSGGSWRAALAAVGAALTAVEVVARGTVRNAFCATRPPGRGAGPEGGSGFSLFNPVLVAARALLNRYRLERVLIVEWGSRAGSGTLKGVGGDPRLRFVSMHSESAGIQGVDWEGNRPVPIPPGSRGEEMLAALIAALDEVTKSFPPDFVLLSLGCDALASDPSGDLALEPADYFALTDALRARAERWCDGRLVSVLEDGYDPKGMGEAVVDHLRALAGLSPRS